MERAAIRVIAKAKFASLRCIEGWPQYFLTEGKFYKPVKIMWNDVTGWWVQIRADDHNLRNYQAKRFEIVRLNP